MKNLANHYFDVIIIGSGAAGLGVALSLPRTIKIAIITKSDLMAGASLRAQGGIAAVMNQSDSLEAHIQDTLRTGDGLCHPDVVAFTVKNAKNAIHWLIEQGVQFTTKNNEFHLNQEGGHTHRRILHAADKTGSVVVNSLVQQILQRNNIDCFTEHTAIDLFLNDDEMCDGVLTLVNKTAQYRYFQAKIIVLATGGASTAYLHTSNPDHTYGDGIAMAWRIGCKIANLEFNQFHPTCFYQKNSRPFLITEAVRGEGGLLKLPDGSRFMPNYDARAELAPRDIVARAIDNEMKKNKLNCIYLDITHQHSNTIKKLFPTIYQYCLQYQINICEDFIPVVPAAHYTCGGVITNLGGQTNIKNLFAIGEVACTGLHGANRMASNSLLECVVFAMNASKTIQIELLNSSIKQENIPEFKLPLGINLPSSEIIQIIKKIREIMWKKVGIVRSNERLQFAKQKIAAIKQNISDVLSPAPLTKEMIELNNLLTVSNLIIECALQRKESRGLHYNHDFPHRLSIAKDTILQKKVYSSCGGLDLSIK